MAPDVSAGWRRECEAAHVDPDPHNADPPERRQPAHRRTSFAGTPRPGELGRDREAPGRTLVVVLRWVDEAAEDVEWTPGMSVWASNPDYSPRARVVAVVYRDDLLRAHPSADLSDLSGVRAAVEEVGTEAKLYPAPRIGRVAL